MAEPTVKKLPAVPRRGVVIKTWAKDTTQAVRALAGGVRGPESAPSGGQTSPFEAFEFASESGDYLICNKFDLHGTATTTTIAIAKPFFLRRTPFDGESRDGITYTYTSDNERTADNGSATEEQVIVPSYVAGDLIIGIKPAGGTALKYQINNDSRVGGRLADVIRESYPGTTIRFVVEWIDTNADARAWAKEAT